MMQKSINSRSTRVASCLPERPWDVQGRSFCKQGNVVSMSDTQSFEEGKKSTGNLDGGQTHTPPPYILHILSAPSGPALRFESCISIWYPAQRSSPMVQQ